MESLSKNNDEALYNEVKMLFGEESDEKIKLAIDLSPNKDMNEIANFILSMSDPEVFEDLKRQKNQSSITVTNDNYKIMIPKILTGINYKMVIVVREDLNLSKGKTAAQVGHAVLGAYKKSAILNKDVVNNWEISGEAKIVLGCANEQELLNIEKMAQNYQLINHSIRDAGRTEISPNTLTCIAIGPDIDAKIDAVTGKLHLLK